jgi:hypothetical protein
MRVLLGPPYSTHAHGGSAVTACHLGIDSTGTAGAELSTGGFTPLVGLADLVGMPTLAAAVALEDGAGAVAVAAVLGASCIIKGRTWLLLISGCIQFQSGFAHACYRTWPVLSGIGPLELQRLWLHVRT